MSGEVGNLPAFTELISRGAEAALTLGLITAHDTSPEQIPWTRLQGRRAEVEGGKGTWITF